MRLLQFYLALLLLCSGYLPGRSQTGSDLRRYDRLLERYIELPNRDSFLYFTQLKIDLCRRADSLENWAWALWTASDFLSSISNDDVAAKQYLETALKDSWRKPYNAEEWEPFGYIQSTRGWHFSQEGKTMQAVQALEEAARIYEQYRYPDFDAIEFFYKRLGNCYTLLGDNDKALAVFLKALMCMGDDETMAGLYCNIGIAYWNKGDLEAAEKYQRQGLSLKNLSRLKRALLLGALAQTLLEKGQTQQAARLSSESLQLLSGETPGAEVLEYRYKSRRTAGMAQMQLGRLPEALRLLTGARADVQACEDQSPRDLGKIEIQLSLLYARQGALREAMSAANRALVAVLPRFAPTRPEDNPSPEYFYEENVLFEALTAKADAAVRLYEKEGDLSLLRLAMDCHDLARQSELRLRNVYQYSSSKLYLQADARAREEQAMRVLRMLYEKTGDPVYLEKAYAVVERSKAALLNDALHKNLVRQRLAGSDRRFEILDSLLQNYSRIEKQLLLSPAAADAAQWRSEADRLLALVSAMESELQRDYPSLVEQRPAAAADWQQLLKPGQAAVVYFDGKETLEIFVFRPGMAPVWHSRPAAQTIRGQAMELLRYFETPNAILDRPADYLAAAYALWQRLMPPEAAQAERLVVAPDGYLNFIPLDALLTAPPPANASLRQADYVLRRQTLQYVWSLSVLLEQQKLRSGGRYALALAPGFAGRQRGLAPLTTPEAERPAGCRVLKGEQADWSHFMDQAGRYRVLHLATHAFAAPQDGRPPRLELYDQSLFLPDIYALPLRADLVTLSACQTGLGHQEAGEGVMSFARAFAQAGAACVVSSLWSVNDRSTGRLLSGFYRNLESGRSIADALHAAKLAYLDDPEMRGAVQSPYFWAGLTMVGDDRMVEEEGGGWWWLLGLGVGVIGFGLWRRARSTRR